MSHWDVLADGHNTSTGWGASGINISSIPATYDHLFLAISGFSIVNNNSWTNGHCEVRINGAVTGSSSTVANYHETQSNGTQGGGGLHRTQAKSFYVAGFNYGNEQGHGWIQFPWYNEANSKRQFFGMFGRRCYHNSSNSNGRMYSFGGSFNTTTAINQVQVMSALGYGLQGSTNEPLVYTLYGIRETA